MNVLILPEVFEDKNDFTYLDRILNICNYLERHKLIVNFPEISNSPNFKRLSPVVQELLEQYYVTARMGRWPEPDVVISKEQKPESFSPEEGAFFLNQPVSIILENALNDSYFVHAIFKNFASNLKLLNTHIKHGWLIFENAGGANGIINIINSKFKAYKLWNRKDTKVFLRCFVLTDSDKLYKDDKLKNDKEVNIGYLYRNKVAYHILTKREMENYLPNETLLSLNEKFFNEYISLEPSHKDFFDLEKGFVFSKSDKGLNPDVLKFYDSVTEPKWEKLKVGLNTEAYNKYNFKSEFPKLFSHETVTKKSLLERCGGNQYENEMQEILNKINKLI